MNRNLIIGLVAVFILVIGGMFLYAYMAREDIADNPEEEPVENEPTAYDYVTRIDAKHFFIDGTHTVAGEILMPTPCDLLEADVMVAESMPEQAMIDVNVINNAETCAQVQTPQRFMVSFDASEDASISARFMGRNVQLNLVPAAEGETPEDFELFIKG